jgi:hypothetical protein
LTILQNYFKFYVLFKILHNINRMLHDLNDQDSQLLKGPCLSLKGQGIYFFYIGSVNEKHSKLRAIFSRFDCYLILLYVINVIKL